MSTEIAWTDETWNPTTGCDRVSPGCDHCYAMTLAKRLKAMGSPRYQVDGDPRTSGPGFGVQTHAVALGQPLRWKRPRKIFVNSMSDLFHEQVPTEFIVQVFAVMAASPQHTFQLLTKRHGRMRALLRGKRFAQDVAVAYPASSVDMPPPIRWPLPNVWVGVSVEDQHWADIRIPALIDTPAAVRFLSCEPLLEPIRLSAAWTGERMVVSDSENVIGMLNDVPRLHWAIVGGESGPGARRMRPEWVRSLVSQCRDGNVTPFVKQFGAVWAREYGGDSHGSDWDLWPEDLRIREFPTPVAVAA